MTLNHRSFADIADLIGLTLVGKACQSVTSLNAAQFKNVPRHCPNCKEAWYEHDSDADKALHKLISAMEDTKKLSDDKAGPCKIMFEVKVSP